MSERVALVTGCSTGIGLLAAVELARSGFRVVATMRNLGAKDALVAKAKEAGVDVDLQRLDVTDAESIRAAREHVERAYGRIDVLVNNAGYGVTGPMEQVDADTLRAVLETNVIGVSETTRAFLPMMRAQRAGRVINVSSVAGRTTIPLMSPYHCSKWGLEGLSEAWSYELRPFGIHMSIVEPGTFKTDFASRSMVKREAPDGPYGAIIETMNKRRETVHKFSADPVRVARVIVKAATSPRPRLRYVVGVDGTVGAYSRALLPSEFFVRMTALALGIPRKL